MPLLNRRKQFASALESVAGSAPAGLASTTGNYDILAIEPSLGFDIETFERGFLRDTLTRVKGLQGKRAMSINFGVELKGTSAGTYAAGAPSFGKWLRAAGMRQVTIDTLDLDASGALTISGGPFRHGEIVDLVYTGGTGTSAGTATVVHDTHNGATVMYLRDVTAPSGPNNDSTNLKVTGQSTGAVVTITDITGDTTWATQYAANKGYSWFPVSDVLKELDTDGTIDNAATKGDIIEGATSGARAIFQATTTDTPKKMQFKPIRGSFSAGEVMNNLTQGNKYADAGATLNEGYVYGHTIAAILNEDGVAATMLGARANVSLKFEVNRPILLNFESRGFLQSVIDLPLVSGTSQDLTTPPLWQGVAFTVADNEASGSVDEADEVTPCLANMEVNLGAQLSDRMCASASTGLDEVFISDRQGSVTLDPEATLEGDIDWLTKLKTGDVVRGRMTVGSSLGNKFYITMPGIQYEGITSGDRDGVLTRDINAKLTGGNLNNLSGSTVALSAIGGDNELVITYLTS